MSRWSKLYVVPVLAAAAAFIPAAATLAGPLEATIGSQIVLDGEGLRPGKAQPRVVLTNPATKRPIALRIVSATDTRVVASVTRGRAGAYDAVVTPPGRDVEPQTFASAVVIVGPRIAAAVPAGVQTGGEVTITGTFFGTKRGKVTVGGKAAKVKSWTDTEIRVVLSKRTPVGPDDVVVTNSVGAATRSAAIVTARTVRYTVKDLGVCEGSITSVPSGIDALGRVIGRCDGNADNVTHGFIYADGAMRILGSLGADNTFPRAISATGIVIGQSWYEPNKSHAFSEDGAIHDLGGGDASYAYGVNSTGTIVGQNQVGGVSHAWIFTGPRAGTDLGTLGGSSSVALAVNDAGLVMGLSQVAGDAREAVFLWNGAGLVDIGSLGGRHTTPAAMNQAGQVCGTSDASSEPHAFLYSGGTMRDLTLFYGISSSAFALNDSGQVTGHTELLRGEVGGSIHAFIADSGPWYHVLGSLGGTRSTGRAINNSGTVVGESTLAAGGGVKHAFVYRDGVMTDLNAYLPPSLARTWTLVEARYINDQGSIAAEGVDTAGVRHAFLLKANP